MTKTREPKILLYDIETSPNLGYVWGAYEQNVLRFTKERELLSFAYCYASDPAIVIVESREGQKSDRSLVKKLAKLLSDSDVVVAHNGDQFDNKIVKSRMLYHGLPPLKQLCSVDTKKAACAYFGFNANSLDALARFLRLGRKMPTPGFSLWEGCMADDPKAWRTMRRYNAHDVRILARVYAKLRPWILNHPSVARIINPISREPGRCPYCGGTHVAKRGIRVTNASANQAWQCKSTKCGGWFKTRLVPNGGAGKPSARLRRVR